MIPGQEVKSVSVCPTGESKSLNDSLVEETIFARQEGVFVLTIKIPGSFLTGMIQNSTVSSLLTPRSLLPTYWLFLFQSLSFLYSELLLILPAQTHWER